METIEKLISEISILEHLLEERNKVLNLIPECPLHGFCLPHMKEWILMQRTKELPEGWEK